MSNKRTIITLVAILLAGLAFTAPVKASATWMGTTDGTWGTAANWNGTSSGILTFNDDYSGVRTIDVGVGQTRANLVRLDFSSATPYTLNNGTLYFSTGGDSTVLTQSSAGSVLINSNMTFAGGTKTFDGLGKGSVTLGGNVSVTDTLNLTSTSYTLGLGGTNTIGTLRANASTTIDIFAGNTRVTTLGNASGYTGTITSTGTGVLTFVSPNGGETVYAALNGSLSIVRAPGGNNGFFNFQGVSNTTGTLTLGRDGSVVAGGSGYTNIQGANGAFTGLSAATIYQKSLLQLNNATDNNANRLGDSTTINLRGGRFLLTGNSANSTETVGNVVASQGLGVIQVNRNGTGTATLTTGTLTRGAGGVLAINCNNGTSATVNTTGMANGVLGWAVYNNTANGLGNTWVSITSNVVGGLASYDSTSSFTSSLNKDISSDLSVSSDSTVNTMRYNNADNGTVTIGSGNTLTIGAGGILVTSTPSNDRTIISGGSLTSGTSDLIFIFQGTNATRTMTVSSAITGDIGLVKAGAGTLVLSGANTYTGETYVTTNDIGTGAPSVIVGRLRVANDNALGTTAGGTTVHDGAALELYGGVTVTGETLSLSGNGAGSSDTGALYSSSGGNTWTGNISLLNRGTNRIGVVSGSTLLLSGVISGYDSNSNLIKTRSTSGGLTGDLTLTGTNTYTGSTTVEAGNLIVGADAPNGANGALGNSTGNVVLGATTGIDNAGLLINGAYTVGRGVTVAANGGSGVTTMGGTNTSGTATFSGGITMGRAITLAAASGGQVDFTGVISGGYAITKAGAGTVRLAGINTYTSGTTVNAGTLLVDNNSGLGTGTATVNGGILRIAAGRTVTNNVTVNNSGNFSVNGTYNTGTLTLNSGGTLSGSGTVGVAITAGSGVTIAPGNSPGIETFASGLSFASGSSYQWELIGNTADIGTSPNYNFDQIVVSGGDLTIAAGATLALTFDSAGSLVDFADGFWSYASGEHSWTIIDFTSSGASSGAFSTLTTDLPYSAYGTFALANVGSDVVLTWTPVPEPGTLVLLAAGGVAVLLRRRRSRRVA